MGRASSPNVFLFIPNIIGYVRIGLLFYSIYKKLDSPIIAIVSYALSALLDAVDGWAARRFNQNSRFGAMLDQLTDRCALMALCMTLCILYPNYMMLFQLSAILDITSHWMHLHSSVLTGAKTHKKSTNTILKYYYESRPFLFFMCAGNEAFYLSLYALKILGNPIWYYMALIFFPVALLKSFISLVHLINASHKIGRYEKFL